MLSSVFEQYDEDSNNNDYNNSLSIIIKVFTIDTIKLLITIQDLFNLLGDLYYENNSFCDKLRPLFKLYINFKNHQRKTQTS